MKLITIKQGVIGVIDAPEKPTKMQCEIECYTNEICQCQIYLEALTKAISETFVPFKDQDISKVIVYALKEEHSLLKEGNVYDVPEGYKVEFEDDPKIKEGDKVKLRTSLIKEEIYYLFSKFKGRGIFPYSYLEGEFEVTRTSGDFFDFSDKVNGRHTDIRFTSKQFYRTNIRKVAILTPVKEEEQEFTFVGQSNEHGVTTSRCNHKYQERVDGIFCCIYCNHELVVEEDTQEEILCCTQCNAPLIGKDHVILNPDSKLTCHDCWSENWSILFQMIREGKHDLVKSKFTLTRKQ
ncbi:MAG TPA: hypothetical protein VL443_30135 [Cyclobacteriaceae bacterium]|jgi:hypothetical protein|nr:hypothetical protein [Cyclobacteriaceae bacterium]